MRKELTDLRRAMRREHIDYYLIPTEDFHGSEYVGDYFQCRRFVSGFTGSAGTLLVTQEEAGLWTDGRYFLQAERELRGSGITLYKSGQPGVPSIKKYLENALGEGDVLAFDGRCVMRKDAADYERLSGKCGAALRMDVDLVGKIWEDRPGFPEEKAWLLDVRYAGQSREEKLRAVRAAMKEKGADQFLLASLCDICWLLNVRGGDVACTPVVLGYLRMDEEETVWYVREGCVTKAVREALAADGVRTAAYDEVYGDVAAIPAGASLLLDEGAVNAALYQCIPEDVRVVDAINPTLLLKAEKNPTEVENERIAHVMDGAAVTKFIYWVKHYAGEKEITECSAAAHLARLREENESYLEPSFSPIMAYGTHGAIVHYSPDEETDCRLEPKGFLLSDTGGHYLEGTTDITRTIALGPLTEEERTCYTMVLRGHIGLTAARFHTGCTGQSLDVLARRPLWERGCDYNHGTGHGVGYLLNVHEGPNSFRFRRASSRDGDCVLKEGMITSDEPGIYLEGKFGVRLENMIVCEKDEENEFGTFLRFAPLTLVPFDRNAILPEQLTEREKNWLNAYHQKVYETLAPLLSPEEADWLKEETAPL